MCWYWFRHLFGVFDWQGHLSAQFAILSGVRQGGICSCWFFNIYIDGILKDLGESGLGCYFKGVFAECLCYADDVILLSGSVVKLQLMLNICYSFAFEWKFTFNGKKSCCMVFGRDFYDKLPQMVIGREDIKWADSCVYLGVELKAGRTFTTLAGRNRRKFCASVNDVIDNSDFLSEECVLEIIQKQCLPILMFGAGAWKLRVEDKSRFGVTFNRAIRRLFGYNDYESIKDILFGFKMLPINLLIDRAQLLLCGACLQSEKILLKMCTVHKRDIVMFS